MVDQGYSFRIKKHICVEKTERMAFERNLTVPCIPEILHVVFWRTYQSRSKIVEGGIEKYNYADKIEAAYCCEQG